MILRSRDNLLLEATIEGYEFPEICNDRDTANWLDVRLFVRTLHGSGVSHVPLLHTWDIPPFAEWLEKLAMGDDISRPFIVFPEPNLQLKLVGKTEGDVVLDVHFVLEQPGRWIVDDEVDTQRHWAGSMHLTVTKEALLAAAASLQSESQRYPTREVPV